MLKVTRLDVVDRHGFVLATKVRSIKSRLLDQLKRFTCDGVQVSQLANCILDGQLCSNSGSCINNECRCDTGKEGQYCETTTSSSSDNTLVIVLGKSLSLSVVTLSSQSLADKNSSDGSQRRLFLRLRFCCCCCCACSWCSW
jgi:hypothetical protein